jgi:hypothetical protein
MTQAVHRPLYRRLLGAAWDDLAAAVRRLHGEAGPVRAAGTMTVRHGDGGPARALVRLAGLPAAGEAVAVRLAVVPLGRGEAWRRSFAGRPFASCQWDRPDGLLAERVGLLEARFRLEVVGGMLVYHPAGSALRLGPLRLPLPRRWAPRISAWEKPAGCDGVHVAVDVSAPLLGLLMAYEGTVKAIEARE